ncbi:MAG: hypothetical protein JEZ06_20960 [Anaerolineaceae bacterium]|nr:hypothetical protein [Anaerolineaceae bacterium]
MNLLHSNPSTRKESGNPRSIRGKILLLFILTSTIPTISTILFISLTSHIRLKEQEYQNLDQTLETQSAFLELWMQERVDDIKLIARNAAFSEFEVNDMSALLDDIANESSVYELIFILDSDGQTVLTSDGEMYDLADRQYFIDAMQGKVVISDAIISRQTNNVVVVVAAPIKLAGEVVGVAAASVSTTVLNELFKLDETNETREIFLINRNQMMITPSRFDQDLKESGLVSERTELELFVDSEGAKSAVEGETGSGQYISYLDREVLGAFTWIDSAGWAMLVEIEDDEAFAASYFMQAISISLMVVSIILLIAAAQVLKNWLSKPLTTFSTSFLEVEQDLKKMTEIIELGSEGNLGHRLNMQSKKIEFQANDELGENAIILNKMITSLHSVSHKFNQMMQNLQKLVANVGESSDEVLTSGKYLLSASNQSRTDIESIQSGIQNISNSTQEQTESASYAASSLEKLLETISGVAKGAQDQVSSLDQAIQFSTKMVEEIQLVSSHANASAKNSKAAKGEAENGSRVVEETIEGMNRIKEMVGLTEDKSAEMNKRSSEIGSIVETINDIASQTNLLALNAAIEAARAGEQGKGFAVVAEEVRRLAVNSAEATKRISTLIKAIQETISETISALQETTVMVDSEVELANQAGLALLKIRQSFEEVNTQIENISHSAAQLSLSSDSLSKEMEAVSAIASQTTNSAGEMTIRADEVSETVTKLENTSKVNSQSSSEMLHSVSGVAAHVLDVAESAEMIVKFSETLNAQVSTFEIGIVEESDLQDVSIVEQWIKDRVEVFEYNGVEIIYEDFGGRVEMNKMRMILDHARSIIHSRPKGSVRVLTDVKNANFSREKVQEVQNFVSENEPFINASAIIGATGVVNIILKTIDTVTNRNLVVFSNKEEALKWLSKQ